MLSSASHPNPGSAATPHPPPTKANLKAWWNHFNFVQKTKKEAFEGPYRAHDDADHPVFGKPLKESLRYASVQISTADSNGDLYVWGYIPVVVAKCGLYLKETATEVPGTFRVNGSNKRMRDLQAAFETPPRYGKSLDWKNENYTTHDVASVFRRYLTQMPEPVIPYDMYHLFRDALNKQPFNQEEVISTYKALIRRMPRPNQYLLLYVLDLLSVFARKSDKNLMTATNLAVIFRPGIIAHPEHEMSPHAHALSQKVLEFLIAHQDWFMLDIIPPAPPGGLQGDDSGEGSGQGGAASGGPGGSGGAGPSGRWGGAPGGSTGKWREGTSTPTRRGTMDSAEGGPSTPRLTTTRQRVISGGPDVGTWHAQGRSSGSTPTHGHPSPITSPPLPHRISQQAYQQHPSQSPPSPSIPHQQQSRYTRPAPEQQHGSYFSAKHGNNSYSNSTLKPNTNANPRDGQRQQTDTLDAGGDSRVFATPMSSMPPSPIEGSASGHAGPSSSGHSHSKKQSSHNTQQDQEYQQYLNSQRHQEEQQPQRQKPSSAQKSGPSAYPAAQSSTTQADPSTRNLGTTPIHAKFAHNDPHPNGNGNIAPSQRIPLPLPIPSAPPLQSRHSTQLPSRQHSQQPTHSYSYPQQLEQSYKRPGHSPIPPSPASGSFPPHGFGYASASPHGSGTSDVDDVMEVPWSAEDDGWSVVSKGFVTTLGSPGAPGNGGGFMALGGGAEDRDREKAREKEEKQRIRALRRRTAMDRTGLNMSDHDYSSANNISPILELPPDILASGGLVRSRTLPSRRGRNGDDSLDKENAKTGSSENQNYHPPPDGNAKDKYKDRERGEKRVLKKQRRVSAANRAAA